MSGDEFKEALEKAGYTQVAFAKVVGVSDRTCRKWALGEARLPNSVVILLKLMLARPELKSVIEDIGTPPVRSRAET